jgi:hypothetical protein
LFFAEIQDGLDSGEVVLLEQPKEELEKKKSGTQTAARKNSGATNSPAGPVQRTARPNT